ncbi:MAG TPA: hemerythrin domain-containing protein [Puia sp.]|nr:hemerythrin domain-containing protein [Puia sp.]
MPENSEFYPQVMQRYVSDHALPGQYTEFIRTLVRVFDEKLFAARDFESFPIALILDYVERTHVFYFEKKLPEIEQSILLLSDHYESHHPILAALRNFFNRYVADLSEHIRAEEEILLPYIKTLLGAGQTAANFSNFVLARRDYSIDRFLEEHHDTEDELKDIRQTIRLYAPPKTNESLYRILLSQLQAFEQDLSVHASIEEEVLIPKARALEKELNAQLLYIFPFN